MFTSLGYHTFAISKSLTKEEAGLLLEEFKKYREKTKEIFIKNTGSNDRDPFGRHCDIAYIGQRKGILWKMRFSSKGYFIDGEYKPCSIKAVINPKVLAGEKSYIVAADEGHLQDIQEHFDHEARKISPRLAGFYSYSLNRVDYCINFDISELMAGCPAQLAKKLPEYIMSLIKRGDIPDHFREEYRESPNGKYEFYLKSSAVVINCYWKHADLIKNFADCQDLEKSYDIIRFEVQYKYPKVWAVASGIEKKIKDRHWALEKMAKEQGLLDFPETESEWKKRNESQLYDEYMKSLQCGKKVIINEMLSDENCSQVIDDYFYKVIKKGGYYTFDAAKKMIESQVPRGKKAERLINTLQMVHDFGGISNVKMALKDEGLEDFRRSLRELDYLRINPVTIPEEWNIGHIPNLLGNYWEIRAEERNKAQEEMMAEQILRDWMKKGKKRKR